MITSTTSRCSNTKLAVVGGSIVISVGALSALGIMGGIELHNKFDAQRAASLAQLESPDVPSNQPSLGPSALPTTTSLPSAQPSLSASPSVEPSPSPSLRPSSRPSDKPSREPSVSPSMSPSQTPTESTSPSAQPSGEPSLHPSVYPSALPSSPPTISTAPTFNPTKRPTNKPTPRPTPRPTNKPISLPSSFRLRLHWERGDLWQDDPREMWFCMACALCDVNEFDENCDVVNYCRDGMMLALTECRPNKWTSAAKFSLLPGHNGLFDYLEGDQIQVANSNLCLSLVGSRVIKLETCNASKIEQRFTGFSSGGNAIEIAPAKVSKKDGVVVEKCLTQHHHPREGERIYSEVVKLARISDTNLWTTY